MSNNLFLLVILCSSRSCLLAVNFIFFCYCCLKLLQLRVVRVSGDCLPMFVFFVPSFKCTQSEKRQRPSERSEAQKMSFLHANPIEKLAFDLDLYHIFLYNIFVMVKMEHVNKQNPMKSMRPKQKS